MDEAQSISAVGLDPYFRNLRMVPRTTFLKAELEINRRTLPSPKSVTDPPSLQYPTAAAYLQYLINLYDAFGKIGGLPAMQHHRSGPKRPHDHEQYTGAGRNDERAYRVRLGLPQSDFNSRLTEGDTGYGGGRTL